jgi:hypothetical protein
LQPGIEAARDLAREYGVELPEWSPEATRRAQERRRQEDSYLKQAAACHKALPRHPEVDAWWEERGLGEELRKRFLLGTNKDGTAAVIPFWHRGRVHGLIRRRLSGKPKYLYPKGEDLPEGHLSLFMPSPVRGGVILVEGIVDALAGAALGESVVATGGTQMSREQRRQLERFPAPIYVLFDADEAGKEATRKHVADLYPRARACPPEYGNGNKDLADLFAVEGQGAGKALGELKVRALDGLDLAISEAPEGSARERYHFAKRRVLPMLARLEDPGEREAAVQDTAESLKLKPGQLRNAPTDPESSEIPEQSQPPTKEEFLDGNDVSLTERKDRRKVDSQDRRGLTATLAAAIQDCGSYAKDAGSKLYHFDTGVYRPGGEEWIAVEVKRLLAENGVSAKWSTHRAKEVAEYIRVDAPRLWEQPPLGRVNVLNGVLNMATGKLEQHTPEFLSPVQLPVPYDPAADCPAWDRFVDDTFPEDARRLAYEIPAWLMTPDTSIQKAILLLGEGSNGKSTYLTALEAFVGRGNCAALSLQKIEGDRFAAARLVGKLEGVMNL